MAFNIQQIMQVTSETLQKKIRDLLPSQQGFGVDLQASNVIVPIVDLTATAEGSSVPTSLQQALAFGSQTSFDIINTTTTIANTAGFYRIFGSAQWKMGTNSTLEFRLSDGLSTKTIYGFNSLGTSDNGVIGVTYDFIVFLDTGESVSGISSTGNAALIGSSRQVASVNGDLTNPSGFTPQ